MRVRQAVCGFSLAVLLAAGASTAVCAAPLLDGAGVSTVARGASGKALLLTAEDPAPAAIPTGGATGVDGTSPWALTETGALTFDRGQLAFSPTVDFSGWRRYQAYITSITFTEPINTQLPDDSSDLFTRLTSLESITGLGAINVANVVNMNSMFDGTSGLRSLDLSGWVTHSDVTMLNFFRYAFSLQELTIGPGTRLSTLAALTNPTVSIDPGATGQWVEIGTGSVQVPAAGSWVGSNTELITRSRQIGGGAGTYVWQRSITVDFAPNGAGVTGTTVAVSGATGAAVTMPPSGFAWPGYVFTDWNTQPDGTGASYSPGSSLTLAGGTTTMYALWKFITLAPTLTDPNDQTVTEGKTATFTVEATGIPEPTVTWEVSADNGASWQPLVSDASATVAPNGLSIAVVGNISTNSGSLYRAVASNDISPDAVSLPARLTVTPAPSGGGGTAGGGGTSGGAPTQAGVSNPLAGTGLEPATAFIAWAALAALAGAAAVAGSLRPGRRRSGE